MDFKWATAGITDEAPRTTGLECIDYMTNGRRWLENIAFTGLFGCLAVYVIRKMPTLPEPSSRCAEKPHSTIRMVLLFAMTFVFGVEIGFKFASQSMLFILNPCHIQAMTQIYLLAARPSKTTTTMFRLQMNNLNGPFLAFLFPEVSTRHMPFEEATYWLEHALLYIIPVYFLISGDLEVEDICDCNWTVLGVLVMLLYHFTFLSPLSMFTGINLDHMLCAALSDPFQGQNYRLYAIVHESILSPVLNKTTVWLCEKLRVCHVEHTHHQRLGTQPIANSNTTTNTSTTIKHERPSIACVDHADNAQRLYLRHNKDPLCSNFASRLKSD